MIRKFVLIPSDKKYYILAAFLFTVMECCPRNVDRFLSLVKDTGIDLHSEILSKLFSKFAIKSHHRTDGCMGLGLFISKNIIEAHGGRIWAENNADGKGATFTFIL